MLEIKKKITVFTLKTIYTSPKPDKIPAWIRELDAKPETLPRNNFQLITPGKEKISFIQWINTGYFSHRPGQASCPGVLDQYKIHSVYCVIFVCLFLFTLVFCLLVCFDFCGLCYFPFLSGGRETWCLLGREVGSTWEECGEGKDYDQNKFYKIFSLRQSNTLLSKVDCLLNSILGRHLIYRNNFQIDSKFSFFLSPHREINRILQNFPVQNQPF